MSYEQGSSDDSTAKITFYVPRGYRVTTGRPPGTPIGTAAATIRAGDLNRIVTVSGRIEVAAPGDFADRSFLCTGTSMHDEFWAIRFEPAGERLVLPAYVDLIANGPAASFSAAQITLCPEPGDVPPGTPSRAPLGAKILLAELTSSSIVNPSTAGLYRWRAVVTPYAPGTGIANSAGTLELQSVVALASTATLRATTRRAKSGFETVTYSGSVRAGERGIGEAVVEVFHGRTRARVKKFRSQASSPRGAFSGSFKIERAARKSTVFLLARASVREHDLEATECIGSFESIPCHAATVGAFSVTSKLVRVTIPAAAKTR